MGFPNSGVGGFWIFKWVFILVYDPTLVDVAFNLVNESPRGYFANSRGVRLEDSLPPLLLSEEVLSRDLIQLFDSDRVKPVSHPIGCRPLTHLLASLDDYGCTSGQILSKEKSFFFWA